MICKRNRRCRVTAWAGAYQYSKNDDGQHASRRFIGDLCNRRAPCDKKRNPLDVKAEAGTFFYVYILQTCSGVASSCYHVP